MKLNTIISLLFLLISIQSITAKEVIDPKVHSGGLTFRSFDAFKEERTSLSLLDGKGLRTKNGFRLEFDIKLYGDAFGCISKIILNDSTSISLVSFTKQKKLHLILSEGGKSTVSEINVDNFLLDNKWTHITIVADKTSIRCFVKNRSGVINKKSSDTHIVNIFFGTNDYKIFFMMDIPQMTIRQIKISDNNKTLRHWSCYEHGENVMYDKIGHYPAKVSNGIWEIDNHTNWKKEMELSFTQGASQIATDTITGRIFVASKDSLFILDITKKSIQRIKVKSGSPYYGTSNYILYDYKSGQLISYNPNENEIIHYNFEQNRWSGSPNNLYLNIHHHNKMIDPRTQKILLFGGYGDYRYKSDFLSWEGDHWKILNLQAQISPRYFASSAFDGKSKLFIFGGIGNTSGSQAQGNLNYYDLYTIDIYSHSVSRLGKIEEPTNRYAFSNSMVIKGAKLYTLGYRNDIQKSAIKLFVMDRNKLECRIFEDSIPYIFHDTESYSDLFCYNGNKIYAVILQKKADKCHVISLYSLSIPAIDRSDILQNDTNNAESPSYYPISIGILVLLVASYYVLNKKNISKKSVIQSVPTLESVNNIILSGHSSIHFLGGFRVIDNRGKDISESFTPIIRQIFLICILYQEKHNKGLTSKYIEDILWLNMEKSKATNNRNVNIRKLRLLLQDLQDISLNKKDNLWNINIPSSYFFDYRTIMNTLQEVNQTPVMDKEKIALIIKIGLTGSLLPDCDFECIDEYKSRFSSLLIEVLTKAANQEEIRNDHKLLVSLCDVIMLHDSLDDNAIQLKCRSLYLLGQKQVSKHCFEKYYAEHLLLLNEAPKFTYEQIIQNTLN